ncbi:MAG: serine protease [Desulfobacter sp.]|nr:serine protease [Desulfobacter sp.]WDP84104.1 MAG: serine protease [Desulfobacter sp.]
MKVYILPVVFQIFGVLVVVAEVFIPSMGLLTAIALGLIGYSLYLAFTTISSAAFFVFLGADLVVLPLVLILGLKILAISPLALKKKLSSGDGVVSQAQGLERYLNKKGRSLTVLRPSGTAVIDDVRLDVVTDGEYIEAQVPVQVTGVTGNQVVVARIG